MATQPMIAGRSISHSGKAGTQAAVLEARQLKMSGKTGENILQDISLYINANEVVSISGTSDSGKTALLKILAGLKPADDGDVLMNGVSLFNYPKLFAPYIGYVMKMSPSSEYLTVFETLDNTARLRLPRGMAAGARRERVEEVIALMDLEGQRGRQYRELNALDRWRARIAMEMIAKPALLVIEEIDERLDPGAELIAMRLLRKISILGVTVILGTNSPVAIERSDKLALLAQSGRLVWFGPPDEAISYFASTDIPKEDREGNGRLGFEEIFAFLEDQPQEILEEWVKKYQAQPAYRRYIDNPLNDKGRDLLLDEHPLTRLRGKSDQIPPPPRIPLPTAFQQLFILIRRSYKLFSHDRNSLILALIVPLILAAGELLIASPQMYDPVIGDATRAILATAILVFLAISVASFSFVREVVKESNFIRREKQVNLKILPYTLSKVSLVIPIAFFQGLVWTAFYFLATRVTTGVAAAPNYLITLFLVALIGGVTGLLASALASSMQTGIAWVILLILPQLVLSGAFLPLTKLNSTVKIISAGMPARFAFESLVTSSGLGRDIARDACWSKPEAQRQTLTEDQKQNCACMGMNIFSQCNFPGVRRFFTSTLQQPAPQPPAPDSGLSQIPVQPTLKQGETLDQFAKEVNNYTLQLEIYQGSVSNYISGMQQYLIDSANWQKQYSLAVGSAEGLIDTQVENYYPIFNVNLVSSWLALLGIGLILMVAFALVLKRRGQE